jgi:TonB family protein
MIPKKLLLIAAMISMGGHLLLVSLTGFVDMRSSSKPQNVLTVDLKETFKPLEKKNTAAAAALRYRKAMASRGIAVSQPSGEETVDLDSQDELYTPYLKKIKKKIERVWCYPQTAKDNGEQGVAVVKFSLNPRGDLIGNVILSSSGFDSLDEGTLAAIREAGPFTPFPPDFQPSVLHVIATFQYRLVGV